MVAQDGCHMLDSSVANKTGQSGHLNSKWQMRMKITLGYYYSNTLTLKEIITKNLYKLYRQKPEQHGRYRGMLQFTDWTCPYRWHPVGFGLTAGYLLARHCSSVYV